MAYPYMLSIPSSSPPGQLTRPAYAPGVTPPRGPRCEHALSSLRSCPRTKPVGIRHLPTRRTRCIGNSDGGKTWLRGSEFQRCISQESACSQRVYMGALNNRGSRRTVVAASSPQPDKAVTMSSTTPMPNAPPAKTGPLALVGTSPGQSPPPPSEGGTGGNTPAPQWVEPSDEADWLQLYTDQGTVLMVACLIGLLSGGFIVLFNFGVRGIEHYAWEGIPLTGRTSVLEHWETIVGVPCLGGVIVSFLRWLAVDYAVPTKKAKSSAAAVARNSAKAAKTGGSLQAARAAWSRFVILVRNSSPFLLGEKEGAVSGALVRREPPDWLRAFLKTAAAAVTLGTGNSLGPEGPSVEIGKSVARNLAWSLKASQARTNSLLAAGAAAGVSAGFNAAISGVFFAVETTLWSTASSEAVPALSLVMVLLSSVVAAITTQAGLGSEPAFRVPQYQLVSPAELPLYMLLGVFCGLVGLSVTRLVDLTARGFKQLDQRHIIPSELQPPLGGLCVGLIALFNPEVLYQGFQNVNYMLKAGTAVYSGGALLQIVIWKVIATSICRSSGLVGGLYAPSIFIGSVVGSCYALGMSSAINTLANGAIAMGVPPEALGWATMGVPQAYALVGAAATLGSLCKVPLTGVLLLFELTRDYRIVLPLMGAVGCSTIVFNIGDKMTSMQLEKMSKKRPAATAAVAVEASTSSTTADVAASNGLPPSSPPPLPSMNADSLLAPGGPEQDRLVALAIQLTNVQQSQVVWSSDPVSQDSTRLVENEVLSLVRVDQAMTKRFLKVQANEVVNDVGRTMVMRRRLSAVVVDENDKFLGLVTLDDILKLNLTADSKKATGESAAAAAAAVCLQMPVVEMATPRDQLIVAYPDWSVRKAQAKMLPRGLRQLPVVLREDPDKVIGLLDKDFLSLELSMEAARGVLTMTATGAKTQN
eukprot:jgi/Mesvir1/9261/Mv03126-RA.1